jgi:hypothetical protein
VTPVETELRTGVPDDRAWEALAAGTWRGPIRVEADAGEYAGMVRLVDADDDERVVGVHAQARRSGGFGGVTLTASVRVGGGRRAGVLALTAETVTTGDATPAAARALEGELARRLAFAVLGRDPSPADDPAWRRRLAARAVLAVGVGVAAGIAGAAWDKRRRSAE